MKTYFVDTNVFLRFFTHDDARQHDRAVTLFKDAAAGKIALVTGPPVLFEVAWTLRATYDVARDKILEVLSSILGIRGLRIADATLVEAAIRAAAGSGQEFADAYIHEQTMALGADAIATFNRRHFEKLGSRLLDL